MPLPPPEAAKWWRAKSWQPKRSSNGMQGLPPQTPLYPPLNPYTPVQVGQHPRSADGAKSEEGYDDDGLRIGRDRVGTLPLPRLPALFQKLDSSHPAFSFGENLRLVAFRVLKQEGVGIQACEVGYRGWCHDPREQYQLPVALVIWSDHAYQHHWKAVCLELRDFVARTSPPMEIGIEILDVTAEELTRSFPLYPDDPIVLAWSSVESPILSILLETDAISMTAVRRGKNDFPSENPETIFVSVPESSATNWVQVQDSIIDLLKNTNLPSVTVEISRGIACQYHSFGSRELPDTIWGDAAVPGISIGPYGSQRLASSTLGGFVELQDSEGNWSTFGLTCYHAAIPPKPTDDVCFDAQEMQRWHQEGFRPAEAAQFAIPIRQPSLKDYDHQVKIWKVEALKDGAQMTRLLENRIPNHPWNEALYDTLQTSVKDLNGRISTANEFVAESKDYLGSVWAGSGNRLTTKRRTLDWCLLELKPGRVGLNKFEPNQFQYAKKYVGPVPGQRMTEAVSPDAVDRVFKMGRTTHWTMGYMSPVQVFTFDDKDYANDDGTPYERVSHDYCVIGHMGADFSESGDSGSFVFDDSGRLVGLLFGGDLKGGVTRILVVEDLFDDIKHMTGAKGVRLPGA